MAVPDEKAETIARVLIDEWISVFGPMESLLSDRGPNLLGCVVDELTAELGIRRMVTYPFHPQANGAVERWNRTVARDIASFVSTGSWIGTRTFTRRLPLQHRCVRGDGNDSVPSDVRS